jgi:hypothetical protein
MSENANLSGGGAISTKNVSKNFFGKDNLERLSRQPNTEVYTYEHDQVPANEILPAKRVEELCVLVRNTALALRRENPRLSRLEMRSEVMKRHPEIGDVFVRRYPYCFDTSADPFTDEKAFKRLLFLIYMRERQESNIVSEDLASFTVNQFLLDEFRTDNKPVSKPVSLPGAESSETSSHTIPRAAF